jgi:competence protein ComGC
MTVTTTKRIATVSRRRALTLIELVVVIAILVALSGLIIPMVQGLGFQTNAATNATVVDDVNRAIGIYATRFDAHPAGWDSLLNGSGTTSIKVHSSLRLASPALVQQLTLTAQQVESLQRSGIYHVHDSDESTGDPNLSIETARPLATGGKVLQLTMDTSGSSRRPVLDGGFRVHQFQDGDEDNEFVVLGLGRWSSMQGASTMQVPLIQSADPTNNYARVCCVYMVPSSSSTATVFPARYVGCFLPDGSTARDNISRYNNSQN